MVDSVLNRSMFIDKNQKFDDLDQQTEDKMVGAYYGVPGALGGELAREFEVLQALLKIQGMLVNR
jgi:hypothetical protein